MVIQKFTLEAIQKVRSLIQAELGAAETNVPLFSGSDAIAEIPSPTSLDDLSHIFTFGGRSPTEQTDLLKNQWSISTFNPGSILLKLPGLWLKPQYRLVSYLYRGGADGTGLILALPETLSTTAHLQKALAQATIAQPPQPENAMPFMAAIDGDRSVASFMIASLLRRELQEFGAVGKRQTWTHHRLVQTLPAKLSWHWQSEMPKDWLPKAIVLPNGQAAVEFFSGRVNAQEVTLYRHLDRYPTDGYVGSGFDQVLAVGGRGAGGQGGRENNKNNK